MSLGSVVLLEYFKLFQFSAQVIGVNLILLLAFLTDDDPVVYFSVVVELVLSVRFSDLACVPDQLVRLWNTRVNPASLLFVYR
jgi:hypothetical protein